MTLRLRQLVLVASGVLLLACSSFGYSRQSQQPSNQQNSSSPKQANAKPAANASSPAKPVTPATEPLVWVNTDSKVFHKRGSKWYGKTKHGKYMTEADARRAGYHPAAKD